MKLYSWTIDYVGRHSTRTSYGVLKAEDEERARDLLWKMMGNDHACNPQVIEIPDESPLTILG